MEWHHNASINNSSNGVRQQAGTSAAPNSNQSQTVAPLGAGALYSAASVSAFQAAATAASASQAVHAASIAPNQQQQAQNTSTGSEALRRQSSGSGNRLQWLVQQVQHELQLGSTQDLSNLNGRELRTLVYAALVPGGEQGCAAAADSGAAAAAAAIAATAEAESAAAAAAAYSAATAVASAAANPLALPPAAAVGSWGSGSVTGTAMFDQRSTFDQFDQASGAAWVNSNSSCNSSSSIMNISLIFEKGLQPTAVGAADSNGWGMPAPFHGQQQQQQQVMRLQPPQLIPQQQLGRQISAPATLLDAYREQQVMLQQLQAIRTEAATTGGVQSGFAWHPSAGK
jgi:hypothetical protein